MKKRMWYRSCFVRPFKSVVPVLSEDITIQDTSYHTLIPVVCLPMDIIFSCIFSHTLGTAKNTVGLTALSVFVSEPFSASGCAKYVHAPRNPSKTPW